MSGVAASSPGEMIGAVLVVALVGMTAGVEVCLRRRAVSGESSARRFLQMTSEAPAAMSASVIVSEIRRDFIGGHSGGKKGGREFYPAEKALLTWCPASKAD